MLLIAGLAVVLGAVAGGYLMAGGALLVLYQPSEFVVIGGAAIGALLVSTPARVLMQAVAQLKAVIAGPTTRAEYVELLSMLYQIFKQAQQGGLMSLESHFEDPKQSPILTKYPKFLARHDAVDFLADSFKVLIVGGIAPHDLEALMDEDMKAHHDEALKPSAALTKIADALPALGIVAAVLGIVITMAHIDAPPAEIGRHVGAALVGTFLGVLLSYGVVGPIAQTLEQRVTADAYYCLCIKAGLLAIYKGNPPAVAIEFARRVLPHSVRPSFNETEEFCRAATVRDGASHAQAA
ncbi:MAG: flagellar motor stator protein MotA [Acidobacteria bacterium]|nr:flagellar motor stator protein MotA [Acidobacteriota bacterium]